MPDRSDRRGFLNKTLAGLAGAGAVYGAEERILLAALTEETEHKEPEQSESAQEAMPYGQIGNLKISRMFLGGNLIGGWAHSRDLIYVSKLFKAYNTEEKIFETLALAEQRGINMVLLDPVCVDVVQKYRHERNGKIQTMVCVNPREDFGQVRDQIQMLADKGATTIYTHGGATDGRTRAGQIDVLARTLEMIKDRGLLAGIGSHSLETTKASEQHKLDPDYYVKTFHDDNYWSATPEDHRKK